MKVKSIVFKNNKVWLLSLILVVTSCATNHVGSSSLAFKEIDGSTLTQVSKVAKQVFKEEGYSLVQELGPHSFRFERNGTREDVLRWAQLGSTDLRMRVDVIVEQMPTGVNTLIRADAFKIKKWGPERLTMVARHPYQKILETIAMKVKALAVK